jgi:GTPases - Sulfate adenylate transferase subunit 1
MLCRDNLNKYHHKIDVNTLERKEAAELQLNEIAQCQLALNKAISFDPYTDIKGTGSFIVIDKYTHATLAAGMIQKASTKVDQQKRVREYSAFEKDLNKMIRENFPEWGCRSLDEL